LTFWRKVDAVRIRHRANKYNSRNSERFETLRYQWNPENPLSGKSPARDLAALAR
jgi:LPS O-antigen subunit length determinant protein (WzzB/FepE family)